MFAPPVKATTAKTAGCASATRHAEGAQRNSSSRDEQEAQPPRTCHAEFVRRANFDFSKVPIFPPDQRAPSKPAQPRLAVGAVNDPLEREADCAADEAMRAPERDHSVASAPKPGEGLQKHPAGPQSAVGEAPAVIHEVLRSPGQSLDAAARAHFEQRFGHRFGDVRIHADGRAAESARLIGAAAYTVATHVVFDAGRYQPRALQGRRLLAHELAHVVQQRANSTAAAVVRLQPPDSKPTYGNIYPEDDQPSARIVRLEKVGELWYEVGPKGDRLAQKVTTIL